MRAFPGIFHKFSGAAWETEAKQRNLFSGKARLFLQMFIVWQHFDGIVGFYYFCGEGRGLVDKKYLENYNDRSAEENFLQEEMK